VSFYGFPAESHHHNVSLFSIVDAAAAGVSSSGKAPTFHASARHLCASLLVSCLLITFADLSSADMLLLSDGPLFQKMVPLPLTARPQKHSFLSFQLVLTKHRVLTDVDRNYLSQSLAQRGYWPQLSPISQLSACFYGAYGVCDF
jgi:hypothetical protein